jgi:hypothetical protein
MIRNLLKRVKIGKALLEINLKSFKIGTYHGSEVYTPALAEIISRTPTQAQMPEQMPPQTA